MRRLSVYLPAALSVALFVWADVSGCRGYRALELRMDDLRLAWRPRQAVDSRVVIVAIDDRSIESEGRWPWSRARMAELVRRLTAEKPLVVSFDMVHSEESGPSDQQSRDDALLAEALRTAPRPVLGYFFDFTREAIEEESARIRTYDVVRVTRSGDVRSLPPWQVERPRVTSNLPILERAAADLGYFNFVPDLDGTIRRAPLALRYGDDVAVPLALATLRQALGQPLSLTLDSRGVRSLRCGQTLLPVDPLGFLRIDYRGPARTFPYFSATDVLNGRLHPGVVEGKIVLVGVTATGVYDLRVTPFATALPGVEIHATVIDNVLQQRFLWSPPAAPWLHSFGALILALAVTVFLHRFRAFRAALASAALLGTYLVLSETLLWRHGCLLAVAGPSLVLVATFTGATLQRYVWEERERRRLRKALELYLSPTAARHVAEHPEALRLGGEKREFTVLFSDVRDFASMSESLPPEQLVELLNTYLGAMTEVVFEYDGMLDKYMGDGLMAIWGAPLPQDDQALRACQAAVAMQRRVADLRSRWRERGWPELHIRVGIHTGPMVFGNLGSTEHLSLTVVGDHVNLASRLEGLNKYYGTCILASQTTVERAGPDLVAREIDWVRVKGRQEPVRVFEVMGFGSFAERALCERLARRFAEALEAYRKREWQSAVMTLRALLDEYPGDAPTKWLLAQCEPLLREPPGPLWEPIHLMEVK